MRRSGRVFTYLAPLLGLSSFALAQGGSVPQAPVGHRQPTASDVPSDDRVLGGGGRAALDTQSYGPARGALPKFDIKRTCRRAQPLAIGEKSAYQSCYNDEVQAQKELSHKWFSFSAASRANCAQAARIGGAASFVELITCLELEKQAAEARIENSKPLSGPGSARPGAKPKGAGPATP